MIDHVGIAVSDANQSRKFYDSALAPIGITLIMAVPADLTQSGGAAFGYGRDESFLDQDCVVTVKRLPNKSLHASGVTAIQNHH